MRWPKPRRALGNTALRLGVRPRLARTQAAGGGGHVGDEQKLRDLFWLIYISPFVGGAIGFLIGWAISAAVCEGGFECAGWVIAGASVGGLGGPAVGLFVMIYRDVKKGAKKFGFDSAEWIFEQHGNPRVMVDDYRFVDNSGITVGWHKGGGVYSLAGDHLGWYQEGVLYDSANKAVGFTGPAQGLLPPAPRLSSTPPWPAVVSSPKSPDFKPELLQPKRTRVWSTVRLVDYF